MKPSNIAVWLILLLTVGCARSVTRIEPGQSMDLSGRWNDSDSRQVADKMIKDLLASEKYKEYSKQLGRKPTIIVGLVRNKTSEHIDADNYIKKFELAIFNSGGDGEWSEPMVVTSPASKCCHKLSRTPAGRSGGAHLATAPSFSKSSSFKTR